MTSLRPSAAPAGGADRRRAGDGAGLSVLTVALRQEHDLVLARQRARQIAAHLGFDRQEQTRLATAVSEIARNALRYAGGGQVAFRLARGDEDVVGDGAARSGAARPDGAGAIAAVARGRLVVRVADQGPGIPHLRDVLEGRYRSRTGMGLGLVGTQRLVDALHVRTAHAAGQPTGTTVILERLLPPGAPAAEGRTVAALAAALAGEAPQSAFEEVQQQNQELVQTLDELRARQAEVEQLNGALQASNDALARANTELEETNRGVLALYAELDDRAAYLARLNDLKTRFLSDVSHELRTPLNAIRNLTRLLLDGTVGPVTAMQEKTVTLIRQSADGLAGLVDDWLDLARIEAGRIVVRPSAFTVDATFGALRALFRPVQALQQQSAQHALAAGGAAEAVSLVFVPAPGLPPLETDEAKVSQVLRNFISNALKFTARGEVRVWAEALPADDEAPARVGIHVRDTGLGIPPEEHGRLFEPFAQVEHEGQRHLGGSGLGLALSRRLARLLGGDVTFVSTPGTGSTFTLTVPVRYVPPAEGDATAEPPATAPRTASTSGA